MNSKPVKGSLMIIGGGEDRTDNKDVLKKFITLAGGKRAPLAIITAASTVPEDVWDMYRVAFGALEAQHVRHIQLPDRNAANDTALADAVAGAAGVFMTGGDQKRLVAVIGGTRVERAMHDAYQAGACIAGTSAGASVMCTHMMAQGKAELAPEKGAAQLAPGLGFVTRVVIDQHFSQRHRINRLLSVVAQSPFLLGAGIDEDTALIVHGPSAIEVMGEGSVTVVDCRRAITNIAEVAAGEVPEMIDVRLHLLPSGACFMAGDGDGERPAHLPADAGRAAPAINDFIAYLTDRTEAK
jgi:cyanophycinase